MVAHCLGLVGELFNCLGAIVLALDIFLRQRGKREFDELQEISYFARMAHSPAIYRGFTVSSLHFAEDFTERKTRRLAFVGTGLLVVGFALLAGYHWLEITEIRERQLTSSEIQKSKNWRKEEMQNAERTVGTCGSMRPILTKVAGKFQVTVPPEIRGLFGLREGDLLEWSYDQESDRLLVVPKRAQLLTAKLQKAIEESKKERAEMLEEAAVSA